jgi:hypothetical protein
MDFTQAAQQGSTKAGEDRKGEEEGRERAAQLVGEAVWHVDQHQQQLLLIRREGGGRYTALLIEK